MEERKVHILGSAVINYVGGSDFVFWLKEEGRKKVFTGEKAESGVIKEVVRIQLAFLSSPRLWRMTKLILSKMMPASKSENTNWG